MAALVRGLHYSKYGILREVIESEFADGLNNFEVISEPKAARNTDIR